MKKEKIFSAILFIGMMCFIQFVQAQGAGPPGPGAGGPIDGGAVALVAGAAAYGYKKLKERKGNKLQP